MTHKIVTGEAVEPTLPRVVSPTTPIPDPVTPTPSPIPEPESDYSVPGIQKGQLDFKREDTRSKIALCYVKGFLYIIAFALIACLVLLSFGKITFENLTAILVTLSGILSGTLGFVIGYYFKSGDIDNRS